MSTTETAVAPAPSTVSLLINLDPGASHAFARRLEGNEATKGEITAARLQLRNLAAAATSRAKAKTGFTFTIENGEILTRSLDLMIVVAVTRTA